MYTVYWTITAPSPPGPLGVLPVERTSRYPQMTYVADLIDALRVCEELRTAQRQGAPISAVTMVSENPDSVGYPGVDVTGEDYDWKKRRI